MTPRPLFGLLLAAIAVVGCRQSAQKTVEKMQRLACSGDAAAFFAYFDREAFAGNVVAAGDRSARTFLAAHNTQINQQGYQESLKTQGAKLRDVVTTTFVEWDSNIKKREAGDFCRMTILDSIETNKEALVRVRTPSGNSKTWSLHLSDEGWRVQDMCSGADCAAAATAVPAAVVVDRASVDVILARIANAARLCRAEVHGGVEALRAQYEMAISDFRSASQQLFPHPPAGIPDAQAREVSAKLDAVAATIRASVDCLVRVEAKGRGSCRELEAETKAASFKLGQSLPGFAAYGSKQIAETIKDLSGENPTH